MQEKPSEVRSPIDECVAKLKSTIPPLEHGAIDSRLEELLNDASLDEKDVIAILQQEFNPEHKH